VRSIITKLAMVALACFILSSCATFGGGSTKLSPKQQSVIWMTLYNQQYKEVQSALFVFFVNENAEKKAYYQKKAEILTELWPVLKDYDDIATSGGTPSEQLAMTVSYLVYKLTDVIVGGIK